MQVSRFVVCALTAAVWLLGSAPPAAAQTPANGVISGRVTLAASGDPAHAVTVVVVGARRTAVTDDEGRFEIRDVPAGTYDVIVQREYFAAARQSVTVSAGQTVSVEFGLELAAHQEALTVTASASGTATAFESFSSVLSLDSTELAKRRGATLADALAGEPGVAMRTFGAGSARPIIRGFDGDRVLIMQDGVRTGDLSSQSGDHGITIDPAGLERLEVVKGPATLLYGSNAIGGVVNAVTPQDAFRTSPFTGYIGTASFDAGSANEQAGANAQIQYGNGSWLVWAGGGSRRTGDFDTPQGTIANSETRLSNGRFGVGWLGQRAFFNLGGTFEDGRFGIPFAGEFHHHHEGEEEVEEDEEVAVDIATDRRNARVDAGIHNLASVFIDTLKVTFDYTDYGHDELEIEGGVENVGTRFQNDTATLRAELEQKRRGRLSGRMGLEWFGRDFAAVGEEALAPATTQTAVAGFVYEEVAFDRFRLLFGGRVERTAYDVSEREEHEHEAEEGEEAHEPPPVRDRDFTGVSGSLGLHADLGDRAAFVANLTAASRAPALEELYNFGPHVGNLAFEIGNPDLDLERTVGLDVSLRTRADRVQAEFSAFVYDIGNFVFLDFTGEEADGLREAEFLQGDSRFVGFEASGRFDLQHGVHLHAGLSYVNARLTGTDEALPRIPPLSGSLELEVPWGPVTFTPEVVFRADQDDVFRDETATAGSAILNLGVTWLLVRGHTSHAVTVQGYNLTDETYRLHTSFIKDLAAEMGRGIRASYTVRFF